MYRALVVAHALLLALPLIPLGAQAPAPAAQYEQGLFDVRVGRTVTVTAPALLSARGTVLLPVDQILSLAGLPPSPETDDSVRSTPVLGERTRAIIDLRTREIRRLGQRIPLLADEVTLHEGTFFLATPRLAEFLGARVEVDMEGLHIAILRSPPFPAELLQASRERWAVYGAGRGLADAGGARAPFTNRTGGFALEWLLSTAGRNPAQNPALQLQLGGALLGGGLVAGTVVTDRGVDRELLSRSWQYAWIAPTSRILRTVQVGNLPSGASFRPVQGIALSNARPLRSGLFSMATILPDVPQGWSYEAYQDGRLLGFSDGGIRVPIQVPLYYGATPVELRFVGPAGEQLSTTYVYQVTPQQLPPGRFEYVVGGGNCPRAMGCRDVRFASADLGVRSWLTIGGAHETLDSAGRRQASPGGRLILATPTGLTLRFDHTRPATTGFVSYRGRRNVAGTLHGGTYTGASSVATFVPTTARRWFVEPSTAVPLPTFGGMRRRQLRVDGRVEAPLGGARDRLRVATALDLPRGLVGLQYDEDVAQPAGQVTLSTLLVTSPSQRRPFADLPLSFAMGVRQGGIRLLQLGANFGDGRSRALNVNLRWTGTRAPGVPGGVSLFTTYNAFLGGMRQSFAVSRQERGGLATSMVVGSTLGISSGGRVLSVDRPSLNQAGITGRVFYDEDGDGRFGPNDRPAADARVHVESQVVSADAQGRYRAWGVIPYEPIRVAVDTLRGVDASYASTTAEQRFRATPNLFNVADFPLVRTREVVGRLEADSGAVLAAGITVELEDSTTGARYQALTFADGEFYVSRVRPGDYALRVAPSALAALRMRIVSGDVRVRVPRDGPDVIDLAPIRLSGARTVVARPGAPPPPEAPLTADERRVRADVLRQAEGRYRMAITLSPGVAGYQASLALVLEELDRPDDALAAHREAVRLDPTFARYRARLAAFLLRLGRIDEAIAELETAVRLEPDGSAFRRALDEARARRGSPRAGPP